MVVTRSLGDRCATKLGVTSEPDIFRIQLDAQDSIILASDGLWDGVEVEETGKLALASTDATKAVSTMIQHAIKSLMQKQIDDNITIILIKNPLG